MYVATNPKEWDIIFKGSSGPLWSCLYGIWFTTYYCTILNLCKDDLYSLDVKKWGMKEKLLSDLSSLKCNIQKKTWLNKITILKMYNAF